MADFLYRLGRWSFRAKWLVITAWAVLLAAVGGSALAFQQGYNDVFEINDTPGARAFELYAENFPDADNPMTAAGVTVVFAAPEGQRLDDPQNEQAVQDVVDSLEANVDGLVPGQRFGNPLTLSPQLEQMVVEQSTASGLPEELALADAANLSLVSADGRIAYTAFDLDVALPADVTQEQRDAITAAMDVGRAEGLQVEAGGAGFGDPIVIESTSEIIGIGVAAVILVVTFGSFVAAGLPLITAIVGVGLGSLLVTLMTAWVSLNNVTPVLAVMLGLAVGIDYALFILFRFRRERHDKPLEEAAGIATGTAGSAVVFAGLTVIIALVALGLAQIPFLTYMGIAAAVTVALAVMVSLTLVPALLGVLGERTFALRIRKGRTPSTDPTSPTNTMGRAWVNFVQKHPGAVLTACVIGLGALSLPIAQLQLSLPSDTQADRGTTQRASAELLAEGFGPGINSPFLVIVDGHEARADAPALEPLVRAQREGAEAAGQEFDPQVAAAQSTFSYVVQKFSTVQGVKHVQIVGQSEDGLAAQLLLTPESAPEDPATNELISALRLQEPQIQEATGAETGITGLVPVQQDITNRLAEVMPQYLGIVVGLAVLLLMIVFRSFWVPIVAGAGFLLSVGAAFGVTVAFWQEGLWGLVPTPGPIIAFMPIFLIGVCFGLAMDYQVFLVSAMREHFASNDGDTMRPGTLLNATEESVVEGFAKSARVVTAAALIMIAVFVAFIGQPIPFIKIFGFALGAGVLFDAFVIRMAFVPAAMFLMGHRTWHMPKWLDKILPHLDVEGHKLQKEHSRA
ncbi:MMPL family transporter [Corynebacterium kozikiae]|uniref:MMPL family transporter n=1 Tax=Corynebacterium kozikiae TaxID=2968469 RepID=UPI00211BA93D|nr:MMPL family transporter [Corynebacterium sp. 76QC2CO]